MTTPNASLPPEDSAEADKGRGAGCGACSGSSFQSPFGYTHPERDKREMCPFCKNEDTRRLNGLELMPYEEYHGQNPFKAFECSACGGQFHYAMNAATHTPGANEKPLK